jgi:Mrp family chromosome partitioning ATPase
MENLSRHEVDNPLLNLATALHEAETAPEAAPDDERSVTRPSQFREPAAEPPAVAELTPEGRRAFLLMSREAPENYLQQFRQLRSRLFRMQAHLRLQQQAFKSMLVTSPSQGDGKSFVALNLALMMAVAPGCRILLADCNVRRPSFPKRFRFPEGPGLREAIKGAPWQAVARQLPGMNLYVTGLGAEAPSTKDPLDCDQLSAWLAKAGGDFDWILLDGPALDESPDAEMLAYATDRTLMVLRREKSEFQHVDRCMATIDPGLLAGVVLNR